MVEFGFDGIKAYGTCLFVLLLPKIFLAGLLLLKSRLHSWLHLFILIMMVMLYSITSLLLAQPCLGVVWGYTSLAPDSYEFRKGP